jgi:hypothetical protein
LKVVIDIPLIVDFAVAANLVGEETVVDEGEETVICPKAGRQKVETSNASVKDLKCILRGKGMSL